ncbi:hypothetical protein NA57DRAFT_59186 [Rhizodiscina lignyota]|uniref:Uncharacterized protein n=1 Tax=Rhizodiscina lignyota TaxID=1504668 RepID=A0A9P4IAI4_9PEZI|nr:hypothetical protein NA57DRAFT_59186 [Rhizodiscina lignyota]
MASSSNNGTDDIEKFHVEITETESPGPPAPPPPSLSNTPPHHGSQLQPAQGPSTIPSVAGASGQERPASEEGLNQGTVASDKDSRDTNSRAGGAPATARGDDVDLRKDAAAGESIPSPEEEDFGGVNPEPSQMEKKSFKMVVETLKSFRRSNKSRKNAKDARKVLNKATGAEDAEQLSDADDKKPGKPSSKALAYLQMDLDFHRLMEDQLSRMVEVVCETRLKANNNTQLHQVVEALQMLVILLQSHESQSSAIIEVLANLSETQPVEQAEESSESKKAESKRQQQYDDFDKFLAESYLFKCCINDGFTPDHAREVVLRDLSTGAIVFNVFEEKEASSFDDVESEVEKRLREKPRTPRNTSAGKHRHADWLHEPITQPETEEEPASNGPANIARLTEMMRTLEDQIEGLQNKRGKKGTEEPEDQQKSKEAQGSESDPQTLHEQLVPTQEKLAELVTSFKDGTIEVAKED